MRDYCNCLLVVNGKREVVGMVRVDVFVRGEGDVLRGFVDVLVIVSLWTCRSA
jgi:hypothetical protein